MSIFRDYYVYPSNSSVDLIFNDARLGRIGSNFTIHLLPRDDRVNYYKL